MGMRNCPRCNGEGKLRDDDYSVSSEIVVAAFRFGETVVGRLLHDNTYVLIGTLAAFYLISRCAPLLLGHP